MSALATMRRRITLMREDKSQGAGGRLVSTHPIIADVWATVEESAGGAEERADKQIYGGTARFTVLYSQNYTLARVIEWRGARYRVSGTEVQREGAPMLVFNARLMEGSTL
ncbi:MAG: phage head closure protein [Kordiimonadaceae bacterium]|nr:phage head closure protein [Kordiimonadaceae bacterium]